MFFQKRYDILNKKFDGKEATILRQPDVNSHYFLGIDGGGTKTLFWLVDTCGQVVAKAEKGACNPNDIGIENAVSLLKDGIRETVGAIPYERITMFAGISGGGLTGDHAEKLRLFFSGFGFFAFDNGSDIENLVALSDEDRAVLVIMGTGFIVYALDGAYRKRIAGWGQFFDDGGCGYTIGRDVITAVLSAFDGSGAQTLLTDLLTERLGETAEAHLAKFYEGGKQYIASFAELAFVGAEKKDGISLMILQKNMAFAAEKIKAGIHALTGREKISVLLAGGITKQHEILFPMLREYLTEETYRLHRLDQEPIEGAVRRAKAIYQRKIQEENYL